jgi:signal transduction histidine kinase
VVEDVDIRVTSRNTKEEPGTTIEIRDLRAKLTRPVVKRLARALVLLSDPFEHAEGFRPILRVPEFVELEARVAASYFDDVEYRISAALDDQGCASARVLDWRGNVLFSADHAAIASKKRKDAPYITPGATFDLWAYTLSGSSFATKTSSLAEVRDWLDVVGGVHVYQNALRVPPYGDEGNDWLDMNLLRVRSPEVRPSTNTSVGRVVVSDDGSRLVQKTDRSGFIESDEFMELRAFAVDVLNWVASARLQQAEARRGAARKRAEDAGRAAANDEQRVRQTLEKADPTATAAFDRYRRARDRQVDSLREDVLLYRTLGTVGTTSSAFAHESVKPAGRIQQGVKLIRSAGRKAFASKFDEAVGKQLDAIDRAANALLQWAQLPLRLLVRDKRRASSTSIATTIEDVIGLLEPFMADAKITLQKEFDDSDLLVHTAPAALESVIVNLVINSLNALVTAGRETSRVIQIQLSADDDRLFAILRISDSGPGIVEMDLEEIWLPGRSSREQGTGLGLTIVRDSVVDMGGTVEAQARGPLGGATFEVRLPVIQAHE